MVNHFTVIVLNLRLTITIYNSITMYIVVTLFNKINKEKKKVKNFIFNAITYKICFT